MKRLRRWLRLRRPTLGGLVRASIVYALIGLVLTAPAVAYYQQPGINGVASRLAGRTVYVHCLTKKESDLDPNISFWGAAAYVEGTVDPITGRWHPVDYTVFSHGICEDLILLAAQGPFDGHNAYDLAWAVIVLTHESGHLKGALWSQSELLTHCWAYQHLRATMNMLKLPKAWQDILYGLALDIQANDMPAEYQFDNCQGVVVPAPNP